MSYDFLNQLGPLALPARLKRLGEAMTQSNRLLYKFFDFEIEPTWMLVFKLLEKYERLTVTEMALKLHFAHPTVIIVIKKMKLEGYLKSESDPSDGRKQYLLLSQKAIDNLSDWNRVWQANEKVIRKLIEDKVSLLKQIEQMEIQLVKSSLKDRTISELNQEENII